MDETGRTAGVTAAEVRESDGWLIEWLRAEAVMKPPRPGWAYGSVSALLLAHGRLFTPAPWPDGGPPPGEPGKCFIESVQYARDSAGGLAYVEGWAWDIAYPVEHAWCSTGAGVVRDLTWPRPGTAYLGLALDGSAAASLMSRHGLAIVHGPDGFVSSIGASWMRDDVPPGLLLDIGRPIPAPALPDCGP